MFPLSDNAVGRGLESPRLLFASPVDTAKIPAASTYALQIIPNLTIIGEVKPNRSYFFLPIVETLADLVDKKAT